MMPQNLNLDGSILTMLELEVQGKVKVEWVKVKVGWLKARPNPKYYRTKLSDKQKRGVNVRLELSWQKKVVFYRLQSQKSVTLTDDILRQIWVILIQIQMIWIILIMLMAVRKALSLNHLGYYRNTMTFTDRESKRKYDNWFKRC